MRVRSAVAIIAVLILSAPSATAAATPAALDPADVASLGAAAAGTVHLDGDASVTRVATVAVAVPPPVGSESIAG